MISIIICSRTAHISEELATNIAETIGCEYELVVIDNSRNSYSIFSAYNEGVRRANGDILCFMHDDIMYKTKDWGVKLEHKFEDKCLGFVGIIGSYILTKGYGYWDMMAPFMTGCVPIREDCSIKNNADVYNAIHEECDEVAFLDGMWLCCKKSLFEKIKFDEVTYTGFHMYDMDICMQALICGYKNFVIRGIEIHHYSKTQFNMSFCNGLDIFHKKWDVYLPICRGISLNKDILHDFSFHIRRNQMFMQGANRNYDAYQSLEQSHAYKLGCFLLKPIYFIKSILA